MVILLPAASQFERFENSLDASRIDVIVKDLTRTNVALIMPKFEYDSSFQLADTLASMGMTNAFSSENANFSGMDGTRDLFIRDVVHKALVSVDESGTEAAAATAAVVGVTAVLPSPVEVTIDRPFVFVIRDIKTKAILFVGRVVNPSV